MLFYFILFDFCFILFYFILFYFILFYFILFYLILSYLPPVFFFFCPVFSQTRDPDPAPCPSLRFLFLFLLKLYLRLFITDSAFFFPLYSFSFLLEVVILGENNLVSNICIGNDLVPK